MADVGSDARARPDQWLFADACALCAGFIADWGDAEANRGATSVFSKNGFSEFGGLRV